MNVPSLVHPLFHEIRVNDVRDYLIDRGWVVKPFNQSEVIVFEGPLDDEGNPIVQLVPASRDMRGFFLRMQELLQSLSIIEERPAEQILHDIVTQCTGEPASRASVWYAFDSTVMPIVFDEVESRRPAAKEQWDKNSLAKSLKRARDVYDSVVWPLDYDCKTLILTASRVVIALAGVFESTALLEAVSLRILRMWRTKCRTFAKEEIESLLVFANRREEFDLCELFLEKVAEPPETGNKAASVKKSRKPKSRRSN